MESVTKIGDKDQLSLRGNNQSERTNNKGRDITTNANTAEQCLVKLCLSEHMSDVVFTFSNYPDVRLPAHKLILSMRSEVFEAMFYGPMAERRNEIDIVDIEPAVMMIVLRYVYTDKYEPDSNSVLACVYAAKKYALEELERQSSVFLESILDIGNVCSIREQAEFYDLGRLHAKCVHFICVNARKFFATSDFPKISYKLLLKILKSDVLVDHEENIFKACLLWTESQCNTRNLPRTTQSKRLVLRNALYQVRFPVMSFEEFARTVSPSGLLTSDEQVMIYQFLGAKTPIASSKFVCQQRMYIIQDIDVTHLGKTSCNILQFSGSNNQQLKLAVVIGSFVPVVNKIFNNNCSIEFMKEGEAITFVQPLDTYNGVYLKFDRKEEESFGSYRSSKYYTSGTEINVRGQRMCITYIPQGLEILCFVVK